MTVDQPFVPVAGQTGPAPGASLSPAPGYQEPYPAAPQSFGAGQIGRVRTTGVCMLLMVVTLGIYAFVWYYQTHEEMKRHSGEGLGGGIALLLAFLVGIAMPFITSAEVGALYERRGQAKPVSGTTGLWSFPGGLLIVGPLVWFIKTNGALNAYWRSVGAR